MKRLLEKYPVGAVCLLVLLCFAPVLLLRDFSPANELRYLSIADEALAGGHVFAFFNHGLPYADKPPLYFWIVMLCRLLCGRHCMFLLGLFSLLPAFGIAAVMDRWAFRYEKPLTRAAAAMMLLSTVLFLGVAVYVRMDMLMCLWIVLALYQFAHGRSGWFGFFTFLALFTKGPVGLLLPPLGAGVYLLASGRWREIGKRFNGAFWLCLVLPTLGWLLGVWFEGGRDYFLNLTVHQTVGRAVRSFHHQAPVWFYLATIWGVAAPWCLLTVPSLGVSLARQPGRGETERLLAWTAVAGLVLLSLFSSKLALYLLPLLPLLTAVFVLAEKRVGWRPWMRGMLGVIAGVFALIGVGAPAAWFGLGRSYIPEEYAFVRSPLLWGAALLFVAGAVVALRGLRSGWQRPVLALGVSLLLAVGVLSPLVPRINLVFGYADICAQVAEKAPAAEVCTLGLNRPENMDVYLHCPVTAVDLGRFAEDPSLIPAGATVILNEKINAAASCRYGSILHDSGRSCVYESALYSVWR